MATHHQHDDGQIVCLVFRKRFFNIVDRTTQTAQKSAFFVQTDFTLQSNDGFEFRSIVCKGFLDLRDFSSRFRQFRISFKRCQPRTYTFDDFGMLGDVFFIEP